MPVKRSTREDIVKQNEHSTGRSVHIGFSTCGDSFNATGTGDVLVRNSHASLVVSLEYHWMPFYARLSLAHKLLALVWFCRCVK